MAVPNSFALASAQMGHDLRIAHPTGYDLDAELMYEIRKHAKDSGGTVEVTNGVDEAFDGAEVIYAKSCGSYKHYGNTEEDVRERQIYRDKWIVDEEKMGRTSDTIFMHCLPVRRK